MKKTIKSFLAVATLVVSLFSVQNVTAQAGRKADKDTKLWRYEVQCVGVGNEGTKLIKVFSYSKKADVAIERAKKNAIHAMIFQGYNGTEWVTFNAEKGDAGITGQSASDQFNFINLIFKIIFT